MDLDELLVNHVQAIAGKVDKLCQHEKYKPDGQLGESRREKDLLYFRSRKLMAILGYSHRTVSKRMGPSASRSISLWILLGQAKSGLGKIVLFG